MFAVIKTGGKQYKVAAEDEVMIERLTGEEGDVVSFSEVLMVGGDKPEIGAPTVAGASVAGTIVRQARGKKIIVFKKRRRQNSRRKNGHRQDLTLVKITDILTGGKAAPKAAKAKAAPKAAPKAETKAAPKTDGALFDAPAGAPDDLKLISGVGPVLEKKLNSLGITKFEQVAKFKKADIDMVDDALSFKGRIERDDWVTQAKALAAGK